MRFKIPLNRLVVCLVTMCLLTSPAFAKEKAAPANTPSYVVGVLPFQDLSGDDHGSELKDALGKKLQATLLNGSSLTPKFMKPGGESGEDTSIDLQYAIKLARHYKTDIAVLGSLVMVEVEEGGNSFSGPSFGGVSLSGNTKSQNATVVLQADVVDVARGEKLASFRVTGKNRQSKVAPDVGSGYGSINLSGGDFGRSALGKATQSAIEQMSSRIVALAAEFKPASDAGVNAGDATARSGGCPVLFRVVGPDLQPISDYTVAVGGKDLTSEVKDGVLSFQNPGTGPVIQVSLTKAPDGVKTKPVYAGKVEGGCEQAERVFALELQEDGEGKFTWW